MKKKMLWIEDNASTDLAHLAAPVITGRKHSLEVADTASEAFLHLSNPDVSYDIIIVDIRIPAGTDPNWVNYYNLKGEDKVQARLGLEILRLFLKPEIAKIKIPVTPPPWIKPEKFAIFTIEGEDELAPDKEALGITIYEQKKATMSSRILLDIANKLSENGKPIGH